MKLKAFFPTLLFTMMVLVSCTKIQDPVFRKIEKFRIKDIGFTQATIGFSVTYYNPNNFGVSVKETEADVYIDSVYLGKFRQDSMVSVNTQAEFSIPISGSIPIGTFLKLNIQGLPQKQILIKADGSTKVGKLGVYITKPIHYQGRHKLNEIKL